MANVRTRRINHRHTLAEIPNMITFDGIERNILSAALIDSPVQNIQIPLSYLSPQLSPDEQIIQLRGRRKISLSPSYHNRGILSSPLKTPTKKLSTMQLRNSPRKRLMPDVPESTPEKEKWFSPHKPTSTSKRIKFSDESAAAKNNPDIPLSKLLKGMSNGQLIDVILGLTKQEPHIEQSIRSILPAPDLKPLEEKLNTLKRNINKSLPKTRLVSKTDSASYSRASTHLEVFKKCLTEQIKLLSDSAHWDSLVDYVLLAWTYVRCLPVFDNTLHNTIRKTCFKLLTQYLGLSLKNGNVFLGDRRLQELSSKIKVMSLDCNEIEQYKKDIEGLIKQPGNKIY